MVKGCWLWEMTVGRGGSTMALLMSGGFWFWLKNKRAAPRREIFKFFL